MGPQLKHKLQTLCELLEWFNSADADSNNGMNPYWANSQSLYGKTLDTIQAIVLDQFGIDICQYGIDWGCDGSFYDTLVAYVSSHGDLSDWQMHKVFNQTM